MLQAISLAWFQSMERLSLPLFVFWVLTDYPDASFSLNNLAFFANRLYGWSYLHSSSSFLHTQDWAFPRLALVLPFRKSTSLQKRPSDIITSNKKKIKFFLDFSKEIQPYEIVFYNQETASNLVSFMWYIQNAYGWNQKVCRHSITWHPCSKWTFPSSIWSAFFPKGQQLPAHWYFQYGGTWWPEYPCCPHSK